MAQALLPTEQRHRSRYTDMQDEPVTHLLAPITGYQDTPLVSLEESLQPVSHLFDCIEGHIWIAKENCQSPADDLTQDESASIHLYTMQFSTEPSLYRVLNIALRSENRQELKPWFAFLKLFLTALYKLPSRAQTIWRGIRDVDLSSQYPAGKKFAWWSVSSCTIAIEILESDQFLGTEGIRTLFSIECQNGKSVSAHSYFRDTEKEVMLMPGSYFEVIGQLKPAKDLHIIHLKEIQPPFPLVKPPFIKASSEALTEKASEITSPAISYTAPPSTQKKVESCGGNACAKCGKCRDWYYDGDIERDLKHYNRSYDSSIMKIEHWTRHEDATCSHTFDRAKTTTFFGIFDHLKFVEVLFGSIRHRLGGNVDDDGERLVSNDLCKCKKK